MTGMARGSSTRRSCCHGVMPTARAASVRAGSTPLMPVTVLRRTGRTPYSVRPMKAGRNPMLCTFNAASSGTIAASRARLGTVWMTAAAPITGRSSHDTRVTATPTGRLTAVLQSRASKVSCRWAVR